MDSNRPAKAAKTDEEWKKQLTPEQAFSNPLNGEKRDGMFACVCCSAPLFRLRPSSIPAPAGRVSGRPSTRTP